MSAFGILIIVLVIRTAISHSRQKRGLAPLPPIRLSVFRPRSFLFLLLAVLWVIFAIPGTTALLIVAADRGIGSPTSIGVAAVMLTLTITSGVWLFAPFRIFEPLINRGKYKLVYYLAHFSFLFARSPETFGPPCFCAGLALARRGSVTRAELDWLNARLAKEVRGAGAFCAAFGFSQAMEARIAENE